MVDRPQGRSKLRWCHASAGMWVGRQTQADSSPIPSEPRGQSQTDRRADGQESIQNEQCNRMLSVEHSWCIPSSGGEAWRFRCQADPELGVSSSTVGYQPHGRQTNSSSAVVLRNATSCPEAAGMQRHPSGPRRAKPAGMTKITSFCSGLTKSTVACKVISWPKVTSCI